jgi:CO dehydrogenase maturation factor
MKIAICGKGGTGKSTVVALLASEFKKTGMRVIVIDSDESNSGLHWMLGLERQPSPLMDFVGGKKDIQGKMLASFSRGQSEPEMSILRRDNIYMEDLPADYMVEGNEKRLITIGKIKQSLEGCACPMGVLSREFLKKLCLGSNEIAIVDMEAGIEHFGRGLETSIDAVIAVIEPSLESINLAKKINDLTSGAGTNFVGVVMNKVSSNNMHEKMSGELEKRRLPILGKIPFSERIVKACLQGQPIELAYSGGETVKIIEKLQTILGLQKMPTKEYKEGNGNDR